MNRFTIPTLCSYTIIFVVAFFFTVVVVSGINLQFPCQQFTVSDCHPDEQSLLGIYPSVDAQQCQNLCDINEDNGCIFFQYDGLVTKNVSCRLLSARHTRGCDVVTGASYPAIEECLTNNVAGLEACNQFTETDCTMVDPMTYADELAVTREECQGLLTGLGPLIDSTYFVYDDNELEKKCRLHHGSRRTCSGLIGAARPNITVCMKSTASAKEVVPFASILSGMLVAILLL